MAAPIVPAPAPALVVVDHAERLAGLGSWEWMPETGKLLWSDNHFRLFGLNPGEIVPTVEWVLRRVHPDDRERFEETLAALTSGEKRDQLDYRIVRPDGAVRWLRATVAAIESDGKLQIAGSVQDVTQQRQLEREVAARIAVTEALERWRSFEQGTSELLAAITTAMGFRLGSLWVREQGHLVGKVVWPVDDVLAPVTQGARIGLTSPLAGESFTTRRPVISSDIASIGSSGRRAALAKAAIAAGVAVPAVFEAETLAVVELLTREPIERTERFARTMHAIGHELGYFLARRRGELEDKMMTRREIDVLQLAARGHSAREIAAQLSLSQATIKRHFERAYARLGVSDRAGAVAEAMRRGLIH